jgi:hypothetical protein
MSDGCERCGAAHLIQACPHVKAIEIDSTGLITRIEFLTPMDFPQVKQEDPDQPYPRLVPKG